MTRVDRHAPNAETVRVSSPAWIALRVEVAHEIADAVANFLVEAGAPGVESAERGDRIRIEAPLTAAAHAGVAGALAQYLASLAEIEPAARGAIVDAVPIPAVDWEALYRRHHRPVAIGERLLVAPPWDVPQAPGREVLVIEPGMAFGTGRHATTRACLEAIEAALAVDPVASALDVGTGSGVLALALARLGVRRVVALDTDAAVVPIARANLVRNAAGRVVVVAGPLAALRARFDLVVANLLADAIVAEADALAAHVEAGGRLVLSGLLEAQLALVRAAYPRWRVVETRAEDDWRTLTMIREP
jgi:ribosomal protein L11 methyltransferase